MKSLKFFALSSAIAAFGLTACNDDDTNTTPDPTSKKEAEVYSSSNSQNKVSKTEFSEDEDGENAEANMSTYVVTYTDADGIYYDTEDDVLYQNDRSNNQLRAYANFSAETENTAINASLSSMAGATVGSVIGPLMNGREIAKSGNKIVIAQDAGGAGVVNAFYIYTKSSGSLTLTDVYLSPIDLWGVHLEGTTMYAIEDGTNNVVVFNDFFNNSTSGLLTADMTVAIEGITRTHGISYDADSDVMVLTDIGDAQNDADGAFVVMANFFAKMNTAGDGGTIALSEQVRVTDQNNMLGNPVDCAYDDRTNKVYIAERLNAGGRIMAYDVPTSSGSSEASYNQTFEGASAIYLVKK